MPPDSPQAGMASGKAETVGLDLPITHLALQPK
jgi:hypothetical protein